MHPHTPSDPARSRRTSRRRALALLGAGGAAGLGTLLSARPAPSAHDGTNALHVGAFNHAPDGASTALVGRPDEHHPVLSVVHEGAQRAFEVSGRTHLAADVERDVLTVVNTLASELAGGISATVRGSDDPELGGAHGVEGVALGPHGVGVIGVSGEGPDYGAGPAVGVQGQSGSGVGVLGIASRSGTGVEARSHVEGGAEQKDFDGIALAVRGRPQFNTAGEGVIAAGADSAFVEHPAVTEHCHVCATLVDDPGASAISWISRAPGRGFTVHLTRPLRRRGPDVRVSYLIVEPEFLVP